MKNPTTDKDGTKHWYKNDKLHRINGPAVEYPDGTTEWYQEGKLHRINGPAVEYADEQNQWYQNGKLHRIDGPAICVDGYKAWYYKGKFIKCSSQEEFERFLKLLIFL